ncbi:hypothetical protein [Chromobacterium sp. ASV23]|uniref:hypothetical protein n=1 Tax=Chromobacterium sp. ASV23 TaxID=2795110 RepID=UPI0018ECE8AE|nr:hypothetical protein [Chromobacterium sp. ASV23]
MESMAYAVAYNERMSVIATCKSNLIAFQKIADATTDPDVKARYVEAVEEIKKNLPVVERQARQYASHAGISSDQFGHIVDPTQYDGYSKTGKGVRFQVINLFDSA